MADETYTYDDLAKEVSTIRSKLIDRYVNRRINRLEGDVTTEQIESWENEAHRLWRETYPALNALTEVSHG